MAYLPLNVPLNLLVHKPEGEKYGQTATEAVLLHVYTYFVTISRLVSQYKREINVIVIILILIGIYLKFNSMTKLNFSMNEGRPICKERCELEKAVDE